MKFRHEWKHEINYLDLLTLRSRLSAVMMSDGNAKNGGYFVRSIYFDTPSDKALREKLDGVNIREKFRIRFYNGDTSLIYLEKKRKVNGLSEKTRCKVSKEETQMIIDGNYDWMMDSGRPVCQELYFRIMAQCLRPKTIVDYFREPFTYPAGNVRVTLDYNIRTGGFRTDVLNMDTISLNLENNPIILEVKWDEYLPDIIRDAVRLPGRRMTAFSKYAQSRIYG